MRWRRRSNKLALYAIIVIWSAIAIAGVAWLIHTEILTGRCSTCQGRKSVQVPCEACDGGKADNFGRLVPCSVCNGSGSTYKPCPNCNSVAKDPHP